MVMHRIACTSCGHRLKFGDEHLGKKAKCPKCGQAMVLPVVPPAVEHPPAVPPTTPPVIPPTPETPLEPLVAGHPEITELVPVLCEHCSEPYQVHNAIGAGMQCDKCQQRTIIALLNTAKLPGPHGPGERGCVPNFRGNAEHYRIAYEAAARTKAQRQQLLDDGVLPSLLSAKMLEQCVCPKYLKGEPEQPLQLAGANLRGALYFFAYKAFESADLRGATLDGSTWLQTSLRGACLDGASMRGCRITGNSDLSHASFRGADLAEGQVTLFAFDQIDAAIDFTGANLEEATIDVDPLMGMAKANFANARMRGCKVSDSVLPMLSEAQRAEVVVIVPEGTLTPEETQWAAARDRRFRSVPILGRKSQTHSYGSAGSATAVQTSYNLSDAQEHVLENHLQRHLLTWEWPAAGLATAIVVLIVTVVGYVWFGWESSWMLWVPLLAGMVGAIAGLASNFSSRTLYRRQAWKDRGIQRDKTKPELHIVFEHEWRQFVENLR